MSKLESEIERNVCKTVQAYGVNNYKLAGEGQKFKPDRNFWKDGKSVYIEFKKKGEKPTKGQLYEMEKLRRNGFVAESFDNEVDAVACLTAAFNLTIKSEKEKKRPTEAELKVLRFVGHRLTVTKIAEEMSKSLSSISAHLRRMKNKDLVTVNDSQGTRKRVWTLTEWGKENIGK